MIYPPSPDDVPTLRQREVNWGDRTKITGSERKTLAWASFVQAGPMVVYATSRVRGGPEAGGVVFLVNIEWGHGGASVYQDFPVVHRLRVPLAASMVKVSGRLVDVAGNAPPSTVSGEISLFIVPGLDGETLRNTQWTADIGNAGTLVAGPARVMRVEGYNAGAADAWLMLFDGSAVAGDVPTLVRHVRAGREFRCVRPDSQAFRTSLTWQASSTPLTLTHDANASLRVDAELLL